MIKQQQFLGIVLVFMALLLTPKANAQAHQKMTF